MALPSTPAGVPLSVPAPGSAPLLAPLAPIALVDSPAQDSFAASTGSLSASVADGAAPSYWIEGATDLGESGLSLEGVTYTLSKAGAYGTLYLNSSTGQYSFQPKSDWSLNGLSASGTDSFTVTVSDGSLSSRQPLLVSFNGSPEAPEQYVVTDAAAPTLTAAAQGLWEQALTQASQRLAELLDRADRDALLTAVFGRAGTEAATFAANQQALLEVISGPGLRIAVELRTNEELGGAAAAYAAVGHTGSERIYVNGDLINSGQLDLTLLTSALLEEYGHALDQRLNGGVDSPGDEGQLFAAEVSGVVLTAEQRGVIDAEDDSATLTIGGVQVLVEEANFTATTSTDTWTGDGTNEILTFNNTGLVQATDRFDGGAGTDTILISSASGLAVDASSAGTTATTGFLNMEAIRFDNSSGMSSATFAAAQFSTSRINLTSLTGAAGTQRLIITGSSNLDLGGLQTFSSWTAGTDRIEIYGPSTAATSVTITGSGTDDFIVPYLTSGSRTAAGSISLTGGGGSDAFYIPSKSAGATVNSNSGANTGTITGMYVINDFTPGTSLASGDRIVQFTANVNTNPYTLPSPQAITLGTNTAWTQGTASTLTISSNSQAIRFFRYTSGLLEFSTATTASAATPISLLTTGDVAAAAQFINNSASQIDASTAVDGIEGTYFYFNASLSDGPHTYLLLQGSNGGNGVSLANDAALIDLKGIGAGQAFNLSGGALYLQDNNAPTVTITDNNSGTAKIDDTVTFTFTFSEAVTGFDTNKVTIGNGTKGTFTSISNAVYTLVVTPTASSAGNITVDVATSGVTDAAGNQATAPAQYTQAFDTQAPSVSSVVATGTAITSGSGILNAGSVITLTVNTSEAVSISGGTPTLTLNSGGTATYASGSGSTALVFTYTVGAGHTAADLQVTALNANGATLIDAAGNSFATFANDPSGTLVIDTSAPTTTVSAIALSADNGTSGSDGITNTGAQTITATLSAALAAASGATSAEQLWASTNNGSTWT
ncbi:MAG: Ig-like domain-containing protein, partial [Synechococcaceae cyanobacterium]|nr:Ig-like domain-containing protein [Synechococcaceae cyanobacterium]